MSRKLIITGVGVGLVGMVASVSLAWASSGRELRQLRQQLGDF